MVNKMLPKPRSRMLPNKKQMAEDAAKVKWSRCRMLTEFQARIFIKKRYFVNCNLELAVGNRNATVN